jgi:glycine/D-amino acid oxidase-like deaminating enzyme
MTTEWDVIVIGGGMAGLAAGATAARAGATTVVLEAHQPGGRARTVERDGFIFNMGGHALYLGGPGAAVLRSLGVVVEGAAPPLDRYRALSGGHQHVLPTGPGTLLRTDLLGRRDKVQFASLLARVPMMKPAGLEGLSVGDWLGTHAMRPRVDAIIRALIRISTYTPDVEEFGADAAVRQLQIGLKSGVIYVHGGWAQIIDRLSALVEVRSGEEVLGVEPGVDGRVQVRTADGALVGRQVVVASGGPAAVRKVLPADPGWPDLGAPLTAACLDVGVRRIPDPGYVLGIDEPLYGTLQGPPARQAPEGQGVVAVIRYGARSAEEDRPELERHLSEVGVRDDDVVTSRFLAHLTVTGAVPRASTGGLRGRPGIGHTGVPGVSLAGDWVGPEGLLADAALASGRAAAERAVLGLDRSPAMVA